MTLAHLLLGGEVEDLWPATPPTHSPASKGMAGQGTLFGPGRDNGLFPARAEEPE